MKRMEFLKEVRGLNLNQLYVKLTEARHKLFELKQSQMLGNLKNSAEMRQVRKSIAVISTIIDHKIAEQVESKV